MAKTMKSKTGLKTPKVVPWIMDEARDVAIYREGFEEEQTAEIAAFGQRMYRKGIRDATLRIAAGKAKTKTPK